MQLHGVPSSSGKSLRVHHQGLPSHLEKQVQGLDLIMEYKVNSNSRQLPVWEVQDAVVVVSVCVCVCISVFKVLLKIKKKLLLLEFESNKQ